ncbi:MAG TPA: DUF72 domain-containing protein, partial [Tepidisphaeraceae bacterium]|nr:DUF72 domain-containing protein [Tepidisphaeraceae bacterium]
TEAALDRWAAKLTAWHDGGEPPNAARTSDAPAPRRASRDVYVYFDNDVKVRSPFDAMGLAARLGLPPPAVPPGPAPVDVAEQPRASWTPMRYPKAKRATGAKTRAAKGGKRATPVKKKVVAKESPAKRKVPARRAPK